MMMLKMKHSFILSLAFGLLLTGCVTGRDYQIMQSELQQLRSKVGTLQNDLNQVNSELTSVNHELATVKNQRAIRLPAGVPEKAIRGRDETPGFRAASLRYQAGDVEGAFAMLKNLPESAQDADTRHLLAEVAYTLRDETLAKKTLEDAIYTRRELRADNITMLQGILQKQKDSAGEAQLSTFLATLNEPTQASENKTADVAESESASSTEAVGEKLSEAATEVEQAVEKTTESLEDKGRALLPEAPMRPKL